MKIFFCVCVCVCGCVCVRARARAHATLVHMGLGWSSGSQIQGQLLVKHLFYHLATPQVMLSIS